MNLKQLKNSQIRATRAGARIGIGWLMVSERAKELVLEALNNNRLSAGPMMELFEKKIAALHSCDYGLMCNSGTSALQIAIGALKERNGWQDGDEILVPALTFIATSNVVLYNGLKPVFVDVEPEFYDIDPEKIEGKITARTRGIIPVHIGGLPCDMDPILEIAGRYGLRTIEDSAETMFVDYKGKPVGSFGDVGCFSTYVAHSISTGVGGQCVTNDPELNVIMKSLMNHGRDPIYTRLDDDQGLAGTDLFELVDRRFSFVRLGHSFRCTELEAALGLAQLEEHAANLQRRRDIAGSFDEGLSGLRASLQLPKVRWDSGHGYMFYPLTIINPEVPRDDLVLYLEGKGIETRYLLPLINQPIYKKLFGDLEQQYPVAAGLNKSAFYIGCHPGMSNEDVTYVLECFQQYFGERK